MILVTEQNNWSCESYKFRELKRSNLLQKLMVCWTKLYCQHVYSSDCNLTMNERTRQCLFRGFTSKPIRQQLIYSTLLRYLHLRKIPPLLMMMQSRWIWIWLPGYEDLIVPHLFSFTQSLLKTVKFLQRYNNNFI